MSEDKIIDDKELEQVNAGANSDKGGYKKDKTNSSGNLEQKTNF